MDADEARSTIEQQTQILQHLNNEYYRLVRVHLLIVGALATAVSIIGPKHLLLTGSDSPITWPSFVLWVIGGVSFATGGGYWIHYITEPRIKSADLKLGRNSGLPEGVEINAFSESVVDCLVYNDGQIDDAESNLDTRQQYLNGSILLMTLGLLAMLLASF